MAGRKIWVNGPTYELILKLYRELGTGFNTLISSASAEAKKFLTGGFRVDFYGSPTGPDRRPSYPSRNWKNGYMAEFKRLYDEGKKLKGGFEESEIERKRYKAKAAPANDFAPSFPSASPKPPDRPSGAALAFVVVVAVLWLLRGK